MPNPQLSGLRLRKYLRILFPAAAGLKKASAIVRNTEA
jgi:hypothetical protein